MSLDHILLGMLDRPRTGYALAREFRDGSAPYWSALLSQIYPTLKRMEKKGWLTSEPAPSLRGKERVLYARTERGRMELRNWLRSGPELDGERCAWLGQLRCLHELGSGEDQAAFLETLGIALAMRIRDLKGRERKLREQLIETTPAHGVNTRALWTFRIRIRALEASLRTLKELSSGHQEEDGGDSARQLELY